MTSSDGSSEAQTPTCWGSPPTIRELWRVYRHSFRPSARYARLRSRGLAGMVDRQFCPPEQFRDVATRLDERMAGGRMIKGPHNSQSTGVARVQWEGREVLVKRYNHKGTLHSVGRTIQGSRARWSWFRSHVLQAAGVASPRPLAFAEVYRGPLIWESYMLQEYVSAHSLRLFLESGETRTEDLLAAARKVHALLASMWARRITHGDLKLDNILLGADAAVLIDIDQIQVHVSGSLYRLAHRKDLAMLRRYLGPHRQFATMMADLMSDQPAPGPGSGTNSQAGERPPGG